MGKPKVSRETSESDVSCLENIVVAYNTVFLMSSIFILSIANSANELFSEFNRLLSPSVLLLIVGGFILFIAGIGFVGIGKRSTTLISMYTLLLLLIFILEVAAGLGILSFRREIKSMVGSKMYRAMMSYSEDPMTANMIDYVQLELHCCGVNNFQDWNYTLDGTLRTNCKTLGLELPNSCCQKINSTMQVNSRGCLPALNFMLQRSSILLSTSVIAICSVQILGIYFSYTLSSMINKLKIQKIMNSQEERRVEVPSNITEKSNYF